MDYKSKIIQRARTAALYKKAYGSLTVDGPYLEFTGQDQKGEFEILFDFVKVYVEDVNYVGPSGDGWNEPIEPGYIDDYKIVGTDIGDTFEVIKTYTNEEQVIVKDPTEIKTISDAYVEQLEGALQEQFSENVQEAGAEEQEARRDPWNDPRL
jgi:hypothetical protein